MATQLRTNFTDFFGAGKLPELEAVIYALQDNYASMIPMLFNEISMDREIYQTTTLSGLSNPTQKPENSPVTFQSLKPGFSKTYTAVTFAAAYRISKESKRDGKFDFISRATQSFAKGFYEVEEYTAANIFDNGFTVNGYDGVPLFSTAHPLENGASIGVNRPTTPSALTVTSYREMRNIMQDTLNEDGQLVRYMPKYLVVPQALQDQACEILKSQYAPNNANNAINTVYEHTMVLPQGYWPYLSSDNAFFMSTDKMEHHLMFLRRQELEVETNYDKYSFAHEMIADKRFTAGYSNWRGVVGNPGV